MAQDEQVLVIQRSLFDKLGAFQGLAFDVERYTEAMFAPGAASFRPRGEMEQDPSFKQIIPYVLMMHEGRLLSYVRGKRAGETRLVGRRSLGIGGHINPQDDAPLFEADFCATYQAAVQREVAEEVEVRSGYTDRVVALLNDDSNEVGQVHLGVVHLWQLETADVVKREQMITQVEFLDAGQLQAVKEEMETWSALCVDGLDRMLEQLLN